MKTPIDYLINIPTDSIILLHLDSISAYVGIIVIGIFLICAMICLKFTDKKPALIASILFQIPMLIQLIGYARYSSSIIASEVDFWSRICYTGTFLMPIFFHILVQVFIKQFRNILMVLITLFSVFSATYVWFDSRQIITHRLLPIDLGEHPTMIKGPLFGPLMFIMFCLLFYSFSIFLKCIFKNASLRRQIWPIAVGTAIWLMAGLYAGLEALGWVPIISPHWIGPTAFVLMVWLFLARLVNNYNKELVLLVNEKEKIYQQMIHDNVTGIYNRDYIMHIISEKLAMQTEQSNENCLLYMDLDDFKCINDRMGHHEGDNILCIMGGIMQEVTRKSSDVAARIGGDEFLLLLADCSEDNAIDIAQRILQVFDIRTKQYIGILDGINLGVSIGICSSNYWHNDISEIIKQPDYAMYAAKRNGKNGIAVYEEQKSIKNNVSNSFAIRLITA